VETQRDATSVRRRTRAVVRGDQHLVLWWHLASSLGCWYQD
jgi:hypothetical protein